MGNGGYSVSSNTLFLVNLSSVPSRIFPFA